METFGPSSEFYPKPFLSLENPPDCLFVQGRPLLPENQYISVVGSRRMACASEQWIRKELSKFLIKSKQPCLCSGGAPGVDTAVHKLALFLGVPTVVFLPCGFGTANSWAIWEDLVKTGQHPLTLITEYPPKTPIRRFHFHQRNRLIAAMSPTTLVIQASLKSGSILTANLSRDMGKQVGVIPAHPSMTGFSGNLKLLREGACMISDNLDLTVFTQSV